MLSREGKLIPSDRAKMGKGTLTLKLLAPSQGIVNSWVSEAERSETDGVEQDQKGTKMHIM